MVVFNLSRLFPSHYFSPPTDGEVKHDAIVKQGTNRDRTVYTSLKDMKVRFVVVGALQSK